MNKTIADLVDVVGTLVAWLPELGTANQKTLLDRLAAIRESIAPFTGNTWGTTRKDGVP